MNFIRSPNSFSFATTRPAIKSQCPPRYLVAEWTTISAPRERGCCKAGEANVLSTQRRQWLAFAILAMASMSDTFKVGLVGVSIQISFVLGVMAWKTFTAFVVST